MLNLSKVENASEVQQEKFGPDFFLRLANLLLNSFLVFACFEADLVPPARGSDPPKSVPDLQHPYLLMSQHCSLSMTGEVFLCSCCSFFFESSFLLVLRTIIVANFGVFWFWMHHEVYVCY